MSKDLIPRVRPSVGKGHSVSNSELQRCLCSSSPSPEILRKGSPRELPIGGWRQGSMKSLFRELSHLPGPWKSRFPQNLTHLAVSLTPGRWNLSHTPNGIYLSVGQELPV